MEQWENTGSSDGLFLEKSWRIEYLQDSRRIRKIIAWNVADELAIWRVFWEDEASYESSAYEPKFMRTNEHSGNCLVSQSLKSLERGIQVHVYVEMQ